LRENVNRGNQRGGSSAILSPLFDFCASGEKADTVLLEGTAVYAVSEFESRLAH